MSGETDGANVSNETLRAVRRERGRIAAALSTFMLVFYTVVTWLMTGGRAVAAAPLWEGAAINVGIAAAVALVVAGVATCFAYTMLCNSRLADIRRRAAAGNAS